jgi:hypothetical protein
MAEIARWLGIYDRAWFFGNQAIEAGLVLEADIPFVVIPAPGSLGMIYLEISDRITDKVLQYHAHAKRLLESPVGRIAGGTARVDLGLCALMLGDIGTADTAIQTGLTSPNLFINLERPRLSGAAALLALKSGKTDLAAHQISEGCAFVEKRKMQHIFPLFSLIEAQTRRAAGELETCLQTFERAEQEASRLGMRPINWQAKIGAAAIYESFGKVSESAAKRESAMEIIGEIASRIDDPELRSAYLQNTQSRTSTIRTPRFM